MSYCYQAILVRSLQQKAKYQYFETTLSMLFYPINCAMLNRKRVSYHNESKVLPTPYLDQEISHFIQQT